MAHAHSPKPSLRFPAMAGEIYPGASPCRRGCQDAKLMNHVGNYRLGVLVWLLSIIGLPIWIQANEGLAFQVAGNLTVTSTRANGSTFKTGTYGFEVGVKDGCWLIKAIYGPDYYQVYGYDGTNVYTYLKDPNNQNFDMLAGQVSEGAYPPVATWHVTVPWLAYASRSYFPDSPVGDIVLPAPWRAASHEPAAHIFRARYADLQKPFSVPKSIDFYVDHSQAESAQTNKLLFFFQRPTSLEMGPDVLMASTQDGSLAASYRVLRTTNLNSIEIPIEFDLTVFQLPKELAAQKKPQLQMHGVVSNISTPVFKSFVPETGKDISITDYRFRDVSAGVASIKYVVHEGKWITDRKSPYLLEILEKSSKRERSVLKGHRSFVIVVRAFFYIIFFSVVTFPLLLWLWNKRIRHNKNKHQNSNP